ncbi:MAG: undecaprenyl-phosphate galactose phosphotransferase WbaP [Alphaproteobacteria bacterium]|nr:undecaprenyl-phosphate galactose phosphotransferase WbaP [Alphaproteobacteria bacterium]
MMQPQSDRVPSISRRDPKKILRLFLIADMTALLFSYLAAWAVAAGINTAFLGRSVDDLGADRFLIFACMMIGAVLWFSHKGHYRKRLTFWSEAEQVIFTMLFCMLIDSFLQFASKQDFSRLWLISGWLMGAVFILVYRSLVRWMLKKEGRWQVRTLLVGQGATAEEAKFALNMEHRLGYTIVAEVPQLLPELKQAGDWQTLCDWHLADFVLIALDGAALSETEHAMTELTRGDIPFAICPPLRGLPVLGMEPTYFFNHDVMLLSRVNRLEEPVPQAIKRLFDLSASLLGMAVLLPFFIITAVFIRRDGGPALYRDQRIGADGKVFDCLKFRTMVMNGEKILADYLAQHAEEAERWQTHRKLSNDPRVTALGRFLRRTSLDELPQLMNVIKGDMSLVGPRPAMVVEAERFGKDIAHYHRVKPGITGLWQVSGRNQLSFERRVALDSWYVRNWSLWHDIAIIAKTIPVVLGRKGAF